MPYNVASSIVPVVDNPLCVGACRCPYCQPATPRPDLRPLPAERLALRHAWPCGPHTLAAPSRGVANEKGQGIPCLLRGQRLEEVNDKVLAFSKSEVFSNP